MKNTIITQIRGHDIYRKGPKRLPKNKGLVSRAQSLRKAGGII